MLPTVHTLPDLARADPLASLNDAQREAACHGDGPLLVIAGAGSGKTMTLAARVARLVRDGADPNRLLLLTFSRRAAQEMQARVGALLRESLGLPPSAAAPRCLRAGNRAPARSYRSLWPCH